MKKITSRQNPEIITIAKLTQSKEREKQQRYLGEGLRTVSTLIKAQQKLEQCYITENKFSEVQSFVPHEKITLITQSVMEKISQATTPSGIVGVFALPKPPSLENFNEGIVLTHMTDPGNMGTLIRTCAALGKKTIVCIEGVDPWNHKVIQSSAGTIGCVDIFQLSWQQVIKQKKIKKMELCALVVSGGKSLHELQINNALLVIGSEAHGIPQEWLKDCDQQITLEMPGGTESLNAAVAGSIAMYQVWIK